MRKLQIYFSRVAQYDITKHFVAFGTVLYFLIPKKGENIYSKMACLYATYGVISCHHSNRSPHFTKICINDNKTATEDGIS